MHIFRKYNYSWHEKSGIRNKILCKFIPPEVELSFIEKQMYKYI